MLAARDKPPVAVAALRRGLDRDVYQIVRKLEDEIGGGGDSSKRRRRGGTALTVSSVYEAIRRSNSSLARQKRRPLEEAIERVLGLRAQEMRADGEGSDSEIEREAAATAAAVTKASKAAATAAALDLNRELVGQWNFSPAASVAMPSAVTAAAAGADQAASDAAGDRMDVDEDSSGNRHQNGEAKPKRRRGERERGKERDRDRAQAGLVASAATTVDRSPPSGISIHDIAGIDSVIHELLDLVWDPLQCGAAFAEMGMRATQGVLLYGPSGCGKTSLANAFAATMGLPYIPVSGPDVVGGMSGESERNIRNIFEEALRLAPCLIFLDEIHDIAGKREGASKAMEGRMITTVSAGMDRLKREAAGSGKYVVVLAATNNPDAIDPTLRRRFGTEIALGMPDEPAREQILRSMTRSMRLAADVDLRALAHLTPGFVGGDLGNVVELAGRISRRRATDRLLERLRRRAGVTEWPLSAATRMELLQAHLHHGRRSEPQGGQQQRQQQEEVDGDEKPKEGQALQQEEDNENEPDLFPPVDFSCFCEAASTVQPAAKREGFSTIPDTTWSHVGAMGLVRETLEEAIIGPIRNPERYAGVGVRPAAGVLLWGPPGCGKTLIAKAVANESRANFISIKGSEVLSKWVGESERAVRQLFARAKAMAPCVIFFDEMDALAPRRDDLGTDSTARVVNALLTELDGVSDRTGIYVIGATNRPDLMDPAITRSGRLGLRVFVGLPSPAERVDILRTIFRNAVPGMSEDPDAMARGGHEADIERAARDPRCDSFSGADLASLMQAAGLAALRRVKMAGSSRRGEKVCITAEDWEQALQKTQPSVRPEHMHRYVDLQE